MPAILPLMPGRLQGCAAGALLALCLGGLACDGSLSLVLSALGISHLESVAPERAPERLRSGARLVQVEDPSSALPVLPGALPLSADAPIPESLCGPDVDVLVLSPDRRAALALAARLARAGAGHVGVVTGEPTVLAALGRRADASPATPSAGAGIEDPTP